jgi:hypothetical protein
MRLLFILVVFIGFNSCKKPCYDFRCKCIDKLELPCYEIGDKNYFSGYIDGTELCLADGVDSYHYNTAILNGFTTTAADPELNTSVGVERHGIRFNISQGIEEYAYTVSIETPMINAESFSFMQQLDTLGDLEYLTVRSGSRREEGYSIQMTYACVEKYGDKENRLDPELFWIILSHTNPHLKQPKGSYIRVANYKKSDLGDAWKYEITFEVRMKLFYFIEKWETFGTLDNAVFSTETIVNK